MQISIWSNMHGQAATSANTCLLASMISQKTAYKTLVAHNHFERSALEGYFINGSGRFEPSVSKLNNQGVDALIRLMRNGRLKPEMISDYTYSILKNHRLDILLGTINREKLDKEDEGLLLSIFECAGSFYDLVILDVHSGLNEANSRIILEGSDIIIFCVNQNQFLLDDITRMFDDNPFLKEKRSAFIVSRYDKKSSLTLGNIARKYRLDKSEIFPIPVNTKFSDALNQGKVFEFIAYYQKAKDGEEKVFMNSLDRLCNYVIKGCVK